MYPIPTAIINAIKGCFSTKSLIALAERSPSAPACWRRLRTPRSIWSAAFLTVFVAPHFMYSIRLATSRFSTARSSRSTAKSGSAFINALMMEYLPSSGNLRPRRCRGDYDSGLPVGEDSEITHPPGSRSKLAEESSALEWVVIAPEFCYWLLPTRWSVAHREKLQNAGTSSASNQVGSAALASKAHLRE